MKRFNKALGLILTLVFAVSVFLTTPITAEASYTYRIKINLGNNADAYFDTDAVESLRNAGYKVEYPVIRKTDGKELKNQLIISELAYNDTIPVDVDSLIKVAYTEDEANMTHYYVKGFRVAGADDLVAMDAEKNVSLQVTGDETYVAAYGVGATIPYTVSYVDKEDNKLLPDDTLYAAEGEVIFVPSRHIDGYRPDAYYKTASKGLKKDTVFKFVYSQGKVTVITTENVVTEETTETVDGGTDYTYEYQYVDGGTTASTTDNGTTSTTTTVDNGVTQTGGTVNNRTENADAGNGADAGNAGNGAGGDAAADEGNETTEISDDSTPRDVIDIDEEEVAKSGKTKDAKDLFFRNMIIGIIIAILAVIAILVTLYIANKKRKAEIARVEKQDNKDNN